MTTPLAKSLKRSLSIDSVEHILRIDPDGLKLTRKGRRLGLTLAWTDLISGDAALAFALQASTQPEVRSSEEKSLREDKKI